MRVANDLSYSKEVIQQPRLQQGVRETATQNEPLTSKAQVSARQFSAGFESTPQMNIENVEQMNIENIEKALADTVDKINAIMKTFDVQAEFSVYQKFNQVMVKVVDTRSDEVIREIPQQKILDLISNLLESSGVLVDETA